MVGFQAAGVQITIDDETLREFVADPSALSRWCEDNPEDPRTVAHLRMLGRLGEAAIAGRRSLADPELPSLVRAVRRTRYAQVLHWQGAFVAAEEQFDLAAEETGLGDPTSPSSLSVLAAVFQHRAKCRFEHAAAASAQGRHGTAEQLGTRAVEDARRALAICRHLGSADDEALAAIQQTVARLERGADSPSAIPPG